MSNMVDVQIADAMPGIFVLDVSGQGAILNQDGSVNARLNGAAPGQHHRNLRKRWRTNGPSGVRWKPCRRHSVPEAAAPGRRPIGGRVADVSYAGAAPGLVAGVIQVNAKFRKTPLAERRTGSDHNWYSDQSGECNGRHGAITLKLQLDEMISRREFAGAVTATAWTARSYAQIEGANDRLNIGVVGCGGMANAHMRRSSNSVKRKTISSLLPSAIYTTSGVTRPPSSPAASRIRVITSCSPTRTSTIS